MRPGPFVRSSLALAAVAASLAGCATSSSPQLPSAGYVTAREQPGEEYVIGPLDQLSIFVWRTRSCPRRCRCAPTAASPRR